jgi:hypothetical protein
VIYTANYLKEAATRKYGKNIMKTLNKKNEVLSIKNNNIYVFIVKKGADFTKSKTEFFINFFDEIEIVIRKEDSRNNITEKTYFRKSRKSAFNLIEKNYESN